MTVKQVVVNMLFVFIFCGAHSSEGWSQVDGTYFPKSMPWTKVKPENADEARAIGQKWLESRKESGMVIVQVFDGKGWVDQRRPARKATNANPPANPPAKTNGQSKIASYQISQDGYWMTLGFSKPIEAATGLGQLRATFQFLAINRVPMGVEFPEGWSVSPRTPTSSFKEGVEFLDLRQGRLTIRVRTNFYAIYGQDKSLKIPMDVRAPEGSYFSIERDLPLDMTISAPISSASDE